MADDDWSDWEDDDEEDVSLIFDADNDPVIPPWLQDKSSNRLEYIIKVAFEEAGPAAIGDALNAVEKLMGWRVEVIADAAALDDYLMSVYSVFDDTAFYFYTTSDDYQQSVYDSHMLSKIYVEQFVQHHLGISTPIKQRLRNVLLRWVRKLS